MNPKRVDFDLSDVVFPRHASQAMRFPELMDQILSHRPQSLETAIWHLGQNAWILKGKTEKLRPLVRI